MMSESKKTYFLLNQSIRNTASKALIGLCLLAFSSGCFAVDSSGISNASSGATDYIDYLPSLSSKLKIPPPITQNKITLDQWGFSDANQAFSNFYGSGARPCWQFNQGTTAISQRPYQTWTRNQVNGVISQNYLVAQSGYYNVKVTLAFNGFGHSPINLWIDQWAESADLSTSPANTEIRLFYSGDAPIQFIEGTTTPGATITFTGGAYLAKGSTIWMPRLWFDSASNSAPSARWCVDVSSVEISLMSAP